MECATALLNFSSGLIFLTVISGYLPDDKRVFNSGEFIFTTTRLGTPKLIHQNYSYVLISRRSLQRDMMHWRCSQQQLKCNARASTSAKGVLYLKGVHSHPPPVSKRQEYVYINEFSLSAGAAELINKNIF